ncbi:MAG: hypothetical protein M1151_06780 [Candidatus Thermoplasmatota archaeon]|jgi:hypothetical protein|nr:hypothetical protein [Candidatus Thermoplasmatota archaeon]MCL5786353.1 hypothetical protein [Candidatus Thermoplasmatota archaeon]
MAQDDILAASEIAQYSFCNVSWYLNKEGVPRDVNSNTRLRTGQRMHASLDRKVSVFRSATAILTGAVILVSVILAVLLIW